MKHGFGSNLYRLFLQLYSVEHKAFSNVLGKWPPIAVGHTTIEDVERNNISLEGQKTAKMSEVLKLV